jgi:predicted enzyme related to lactoylglutathione lyase
MNGRNVAAQRNRGGKVRHGSADQGFTWYELMTTDMASARAFYADVVGWETQDASTPDLAYTLFSARGTPTCGLLSLPEEARAQGATPRWIGYIGVDDIEDAAKGIARRGGRVYVAPTTSNIGRIAVVADPQSASFALVEGLRPSRGQTPSLSPPGHVGWHELFAADPNAAFAFYGELFGWRKPRKDTAPEPYPLFSVGEQICGGILPKLPFAPAPFWLYYFNVDDLDRALGRVQAGGGQIFGGPHETPGGNWCAQCSDPQGAVFALEGARNANAITWNTSWGDFSAKGRLVTEPRPKDKP